MSAEPAEVKKDTRAYIKLSLDFLENHRTGPLSPVAKLTLIGLWMYCARNRTDGVVPAPYARRSVPKRLREALTMAGCWQHHDCTTATPCLHGACTAAAPCGQEAFVMHDYSSHQSLHSAAADKPAKDSRGYIKLSVDFLENHRTGPLSPVAKLTLIELWMYCHRNRTNGVVPAAAARRIAPRRIRDALTTAGCWQYHDCTTATPCRYGACTVSAPCRQGCDTMHDYRKHQNQYFNHPGRVEKASSSGTSRGTAKQRETSETATGIASETTDAAAGLVYASHKLQVIYPSIPLGDNPAVSNPREGKPQREKPPQSPSPPSRLGPRPRHGGHDVADRLNAAVPEIPATPAMRRRVLARLAPDAVAVLDDPHAGPVHRAHAQADLDRAAAVIDARAEYLDTGDVSENPKADRLFDPHGDTGYARRMAAAQTPLPVPDPITPGEVRAMAFRLARDHIDAITRHGGRAPGSAREALRAELEALLGDGVHQDLLRAELAAMLNGGIWAASKLRERLHEARR
ncbi:hypothetical protein [Nocardia pseudovaccinii]|uniref:hypothetical protein n=1 Tax=Nocardia pseudovaccinii TaxID=189540 RepID=UPI0007A4918F|nr:hypothetical protein [Nocardia pseudovaccinii]